MQERNPADWRRDVWIAQREVEQGSRGDERQRWQLLREPAQLGEHFWRGLDLVQEEQRRPVDRNPSAKRDLEARQRGARIVVREAARKLRPALEIGFDHRLEPALCPRSRQVGLSDLPAPPKNQGLPARVLPPSVQVDLPGPQHVSLLHEPAKRSI